MVLKQASVSLSSAGPKGSRDGSSVRLCGFQHLSLSGWCSARSERGSSPAAPVCRIWGDNALPQVGRKWIWFEQTTLPNPASCSWLLFTAGEADRKTSSVTGESHFVLSQAGRNRMAAGFPAFQMSWRITFISWLRRQRGWGPPGSSLHSTQPNCLMKWGPWEKDS